MADEAFEFPTSIPSVPKEAPKELKKRDSSSGLAEELEEEEEKAKEEEGEKAKEEEEEKAKEEEERKAQEE